MGLMRFTVADRDRIPEEHLLRIFFAGPDELPHTGRAYFSGDQLVLERRDEGSGCLWVPWPHGDLGEWLVGTSTLMQRDKPYQLEVEIARGSVYRLRNQFAAWEQLGLKRNSDVTDTIAQATWLFARAASNQDDPAKAAEMADQAMMAAAEGALKLTALYAKQAMEVRLSTVKKLPTLLGIRLGDSAPETPDGELSGAFSSAVIPCSWEMVEPSEGKRRWNVLDQQFEWAQQAGMRICAGPLIEFSDQCIPDWAYLWEGDFDALTSLLVSHVEAVVARYQGKVQLWNVAGRVNRNKVLDLSDEQRLQLVARAVRAVREADPKVPAVVSFDQPWGEYLANENTELAPIDFAEALERADLGIAGFGLELNVGYGPGGTALRSPLAFSRLLDMWSLRLEVPLMLMLSAPSSVEPDPKAMPKTKVTACGVHGAKIDEDFQARWIELTLPMMLAKNCVQVVQWNHYRDDQPHMFPHCGLLDADGKPKEAVDVLRQMRNTHLV